MRYATVEAGPLDPGTSAQTAELVALTQVLWLANVRTVNIYTDFEYAFLILTGMKLYGKNVGG